MRFFALALAATMMALFTGSAAAESEDGDDGSDFTFERYLAESHSWGRVTAAFGPDFIELAWDDLVLGEEASHDLRALADGALTREKDGDVSEQEVNDFTFALSALFESWANKLANNHAFSGFVLIDQAEAQSVKVERVHADGLSGPVDRSSPITVSFQLRAVFPNVDDGKDLHTIRFDLGPYFVREGLEDEAAKFAGDLTLSLQGAPGWSIDAESIQPSCAGEEFADGRMTFAGSDAACFTGRSGVLLSFAITGKGESPLHFLPGFELAGVLAALGGLAVARRRL